MSEYKLVLLVTGIALLGAAWLPHVLKRRALSFPALYVGLGVLLYAIGLPLPDPDPIQHGVVVERITELTVLVALLGAGIRIDTRFGWRRWGVTWRLLGIAMPITILAGWLLGMELLGYGFATAALLGAVLAPTDPVLASEVQVQHSDDRDRLRFSLTGEGGLNDGAAFPFVMLALGLLGLHELGFGGLRWWSVDVLWAVAGGIGIGWLLGFVFSRAVLYLRREREQALGMESFLTLGLIALTYGVALTIHTYGFLAVFAAGLAMRQVEREDNLAPRVAADALPPESATVSDPGPPPAASPAQASAYMTKAVLDFTLDIEKLAELTVMLLIGSLLTLQTFTPSALAVALGLIFVARPLAVVLTTWRLPLTRAQRRLAGWFGIRGIGSMYYLAYAVAHGADNGETARVADAVLATIALSVLLHGSTATPIMRLYRRARGRL